jgi:ABC-type branched-subunit amino acid transport system permease subunit
VNNRGPRLAMGGLRQRLERNADFFSRHRSISVVAGMVLVALALPLIVLLPPLSGFDTQGVWIDQFNGAGIFVLLALGLNVVVGLAGLLDLGYAAFFAIGAYTYGLLASTFYNIHVPFWPMLILGAIVAALFGVALGAPTLRLRGDYLAIVTLGFGEIVPVFFTNSDTLTNGTNGIAGVDRPSLPGIEFGAANPIPYYVTMVVILSLVLILLYRLQESRLGRAWMAIREDELAAASSGINTITTKLLAFALGATTSGFAGVFAASRLIFVSPDQFGFTVSFTVLAMVVLGGMGNIWGVAAGAFIVFLIQSVFLKQLTIFFQPLNIPVLSSINFLDYQFLLFGIALVGMMLLRPEGLFPSTRRRQELHTVSGEEELASPSESSEPLG